MSATNTITLFLSWGVVGVKCFFFGLSGQTKFSMNGHGGDKVNGHAKMNGHGGDKVNGHSENNGYGDDVDGHAAAKSKGHASKVNGHTAKVSVHGPEGNVHATQVNGHAAKANGQAEMLDESMKGYMDLETPKMPKKVALKI